MNGKGYKQHWITIALALALAIAAGSVFAEQISVDYSFERPEIQKITIGSDTYDRIVMADAPNYA